MLVCGSRTEMLPSKALHSTAASTVMSISSDCSKRNSAVLRQSTENVITNNIQKKLEK